MTSENPLRLTLPLDRSALATLKAGQACTLTGPLFTLRDAGHQRLLEEMGESDKLPYGLSNQTIFYAGPTPEAAGSPVWGNRTYHCFTYGLCGTFSYELWCCCNCRKRNAQ